MDNFQGGLRTTLSTAEPGTPLMSVGRLRGKQTRRNKKDSRLTNLMESTLTPLSACPKDGVHLSSLLSYNAQISCGQIHRLS